MTGQCECRDEFHEGRCQNDAEQYADLTTSPQLCTSCVFGCMP